jgi:MFS family permease
MDASDRHRLRPIISFVAGNVLFATGLIFHAFLYNFYLGALQLSAVVMGHAAAALTGGGLVVLLPAGVLVDRAGPRAAVMVAAAVLALGLALGAVAATPLAVYGAAALAGVGSGIWRVAVGPILMALTEGRTRARAFAWNVGLLVGWGGVGTAIAGAGSHFLEARWGLERLAALRTALVLGAAGSAASALLFRVLRPAAGSVPRALVVGGSQGASQPEGGPAAAPRRMLLLVGLVAVWMLGPALAAPFFNIFFARVHGLPIEHVGLIFGAGNVAWALAVLASGEVASRVGVRRVLVGSLLGFAPAMWGLSLAESVELAVALYYLQGLIGPVTNPLIDQWLLGQTPRERQGAVSSWRQVAADLSAMLGASLGGYLLGGVGGRGAPFDQLFLVAGAIGLVGALGLIAGARMRPDS